MKKLYVLLIAMISVSALSAQQRNRNNDQHGNYSKDNQWSGSGSYGNDHNRNYSDNNRSYGGKQEMSERDRRAAMDRINHDYDQRIIRYRNDRSVSMYERDRRIAQAQRERQQQLNTFGKGAIVGGVVGLIAGLILSH